MLTYTMDIEKRSTWFRSTPSEAGRSLPFFCTEAGTFYARERFTTERSHKDSYLVFYTLGGAGIIEQGGQSITLGQNQALLMDCRTPQRYVTDPVRHHWYHLWAHVNGAGADAIAKAMGLPKLQPVSLPLADVKPIFETIFENMKKEGYIESLTTSLAVDRLLTSIALALIREDPSSSSMRSLSPAATWRSTSQRTCMWTMWQEKLPSPPLS
jgi:hypothetical protein